MAIKTSWTAGEVLTAADLTDTFADKVDLTPSATQTITSGTATVKPLVIKAAASQTANLLEFQNSAGTAVRAVLPDGTITGQNLLYNGAMQVAQRGTSTASITTNGYYTADRWAFELSSLGTWTQSVENDAPTGSGFRRSLKMLCTSADASPAAGDFALLAQTLEGQDLQRIAKGTSSAQQLTLSFWVKGSTTGTYIVELLDQDNSRICCLSYTISASATWERKTITFPADTTGAFDNDNAASLRVAWLLGAGTTYTSGTLATTWATNTAANRAVGQTNLAAATNNYWQITGVQLEVGPVASAFEFKSYGQELAECQRYYYLAASGSSSYVANGNNYATTLAQGWLPAPVTMRASASGVATSGTDYYAFERNNAEDLFNSVLFVGTTTGAVIYNNTEISGTAGHGGLFKTKNAASSIALSAEL